MLSLTESVSPFLDADASLRRKRRSYFSACLATILGCYVFDEVRASYSPGVGKSHALAAVGHELVLAGHPVCWTSTATFIQRLLAAKRDLRLPQELSKLDGFASVILDDIGYVQQDRDEMEILFTFLAERYEHKSVMLTTNLVFSEWNHIFINPMTTLDVS
jgi:DNA replication protein DnaC